MNDILNIPNVIKFIEKSKGKEVSCYIDSDGYLVIWGGKELERNRYMYTKFNFIKKYGLKICTFCDILHTKRDVPLIEDW